MREIKFGAKIKGDAGVYEVWAIDWLHQQMFIGRACGTEWVAFDKIQALLQFTGMSDKNSVEIYEGDIVRRHWDDGTYEDGQIIFQDASFLWLHGKFPIGINTLHSEVIGNRFERSEHSN